MANYRTRPASLYEGQDLDHIAARAGHGASNMASQNYATYSSQHLNHLTSQQQLQQQQQHHVNGAFSSSNVNLQNLVQQSQQAAAIQANGISPGSVNPNPYVQQPYSTTDLHRFSQNADKYTSDVSFLLLIAYPMLMRQNEMYFLKCRRQFIVMCHIIRVKNVNLISIIH